MAESRSEAKDSTASARFTVGTCGDSRVFLRPDRRGYRRMSQHTKNTLGAGDTRARQYVLLMLYHN